MYLQLIVMTLLYWRWWYWCSDWYREDASDALDQM